MIKKLALIYITTALILLVCNIYILKKPRHSTPPASNITYEADEKTWADFVEIKKATNNYQHPVTASIVFIGDVSFSRGVGQVIRFKKDSNYPFASISGYLKDADLTIANLESPITSGREIQNGEMVFRSNPGTEIALKNAGIDIVNLANNHTPDFGDVGIKNTLEYLSKESIKYMGAGESLEAAIEPLIIEKNSIKFAFISFTDPSLVSPKYEATPTSAGTAFMRLELLASSITQARKKADIVIVSMHSGTEYEPEPNETQTTFAQYAIDSGADLVVGHHPHVVQPIKQYKGKYIIYSLGNFVLDQMWSQETREGLAVKVIFSNKEVQNIAVNTTLIENYSQPHIINDSQSNKILERIMIPHKSQPTVYWDTLSKEYKLTDQKYIGNNNYLNIASIVQTNDLDKDDTNEIYKLENGRLNILVNNKILWRSQENWWIDSFILSDVNNDGTEDINMSVWKQGSFDKFLPIWQDKNDMSIKNHFFVLDWDSKKGIKPVWQSSNLAKPNCSFKIVDLDNDGNYELVTQEGDYTENHSCTTNNYGVWKWDEFGFTNVWNSDNK